MRAAFQPGVLVRFKVPNGARATIVKYDCEDFYIVRIDGDVVSPPTANAPRGRLLAIDGKHYVAHQDDLELVPKEAP